MSEGKTYEDIQQQRVRVNSLKRKLGDLRKRKDSNYVKKRHASDVYVQFLDTLKEERKKQPSIVEICKFVNRCTIKLSVLDKLAGYLISFPHSYRNRHKRGSGATRPETLTFLDLGGPGGFVEYLLIVHKWQTRGLGCTLKGELDYNFRSANPNASANTFLSFANSDKRFSSGDILDPEIQKGIILISKKLAPGYDLVLGDAAFDVDNKEEDQETNLIPLIMAEIFLACGLLNKGGTLLLKTFDLSQTISLHALHFLWEHFETLDLLKPPESREENSERYALATNFLQKTTTPVSLDQMTQPRVLPPEFLTFVNRHLSETYKKQQEKLQWLVSDTIKSASLPATSTLDYLTSWNFDILKNLSCQRIGGQSEQKERGKIRLFLQYKKLYLQNEYLLEVCQCVQPMLNQNIRSRHNLLLRCNDKLLEVKTTKKCELMLNPVSERTPLTSYLSTIDNNVLLVVDDNFLQVVDVVALPLWPKLFMKSRAEREQFWITFQTNQNWWKDVLVPFPFAKIPTQA